MLSFNFMAGLAMGESPEAGWFAWLMDGVGSLEVGVNSSQQDWEVAVRKRWESEVKQLVW